MRRRALCAVVLALLCVAGGATAAPARPNFPDVENQYMCVTCNLPLPEAESDQASRERAFLRRLIAAGDNETQIRRAMVAVYTDKVLQLPPRSGFNLVAYVVPVVAVLALAGALLLVLPRWRRRSVQSATAPAIPDADNARLNADLAQFDL